MAEASNPSLRRRSRLPILGLALAAGAIGLSGCDLPKDPESTLRSVTGKTLKVGLLVDPAHLHDEDGQAIARLGQALSADISLQRAAPDILVTKLETGDIHLLVGDLPKDTVLAKRLGLSNKIGTVAVDGEGHDRVVGVRRGENAFLLFVNRTLGAGGR